MKRFVLILLAAFGSTVMYGQGQFENPSFEGVWDADGNPEQEPVEWSSLKTADQLGGAAPQVLWQTTTAHSGSYACSLVVAPYNWLAGVSPNSLVTNGKVHAEFTAANGFVYTDTSDPDYNTTCTTRPDSLVGWFQYSPQGGDVGKVQVLVHDDSYIVDDINNNNVNAGRMPHDGTYSHWVGLARYDVTTTTSTWTRFSVPFNYYNNNYPDYVLLVASSGDSLQAVTGSMMLLDDVELIHNPLLVSADPAATQNIDACVNGTTLTITEGTNAGVTSAPTREWKWSNSSGGPYSSFGTPETGTTYTPLFTTVGTYYVVCETDYGTQGIVTSNEVEIVVTAGAGSVVSISPVTTQNINEAQNGTDLTATECPTATVRDWKWTTTSGSGYTSFAPVETGTTYTPNFTTAGTYYVICESDFAGNLVNSNEVIIIVAPAGTGIDEHGIKFNIFNTGSFIQVDYEGLSDEAYLELYTLDGKQVYNTSIATGTTQHHVNISNGIYVYRMIDGDKIVTGQINL